MTSILGRSVDHLFVVTGQLEHQAQPVRAVMPAGHPVGIPHGSGRSFVEREHLFAVFQACVQGAAEYLVGIGVHEGVAATAGARPARVSFGWFSGIAGAGLKRGWFVFEKDVGIVVARAPADGGIIAG